MGISLKQEIINCKNNFSQFKNSQLVEPPQFFKILPNKFFPRKIASAFKGPLAFSASKLKNLHWYFIVCTFILHLAISRQFSLQFLFKCLLLSSCQVSMKWGLRYSNSTITARFFGKKAHGHGKYPLKLWKQEWSNFKRGVFLHIGLISNGRHGSKSF